MIAILKSQSSALFLLDYMTKGKSLLNCIDYINSDSNDDHQKDLNIKITE